MATKFLFTKFKHWEYEEEWRVYVTLDESGNDRCWPKADVPRNLIHRYVPERCGLEYENG